MTIWASRGRHSLLRFRRRDWRSMVEELGRRGGGQKEAGAFLLAPRDGDRRRVDRIVYLDDLDPNCLQGAISFDGRAYSKLWDICDATGLRVLGDVHTHGGDWVGQSDVDKQNPMVAAEGHIALILPHLSTRPVQAREVGLHRYGGASGWRSWFGAEAAERLFIRRLV